MLDDGPTAARRWALLRHHRRSQARPGRQAPPGPGARAGEAGAVDFSWLQMTLREGRKRQLRRMVALLGHPALRVIRIGLGPLSWASCTRGKWRDLTPGEVRSCAALLPPRSPAQGASTRTPTTERKAGLWSLQPSR